MGVGVEGKGEAEAGPGGALLRVRASREFLAVPQHLAEGARGARLLADIGSAHAATACLQRTRALAANLPSRAIMKPR